MHHVTYRETPLIQTVPFLVLSILANVRSIESRDALIVALWIGKKTGVGRINGCPMYMYANKLSMEPLGVVELELKVN